MTSLFKEQEITIPQECLAIEDFKFRAQEQRQSRVDSVSEWRKTMIEGMYAFRRKDNGEIFEIGVRVTNDTPFVIISPSCRGRTISHEEMREIAGRFFKKDEEVHVYDAGYIPLTLEQSFVGRGSTFFLSTPPPGQHKSREDAE